MCKKQPMTFFVRVLQVWTIAIATACATTRDVYCISNHSCYNDTVADGNIIECSGASSCQSNYLSFQEFLTCYGDSSCHNSSLVSLGDSVDRYGTTITCNGYSSCSNSIISTNFTILCSASQSCNSTQITTSDVFRGLTGLESSLHQQ